MIPQNLSITVGMGIGFWAIYFGGGGRVFISLLGFPDRCRINPPLRFIGIYGVRRLDDRLGADGLPLAGRLLLGRESRDESERRCCC